VVSDALDLPKIPYLDIEVFEPSSFSEKITSPDNTLSNDLAILSSFLAPSEKGKCGVLGYFFTSIIVFYLIYKNNHFI
jgi:hypothetical protein